MGEKLSVEMQNSINTYWKRCIRNPNVSYSPVSLKKLQDWTNKVTQLEKEIDEVDEENPTD